MIHTSYAETHYFRCVCAEDMTFTHGHTFQNIMYKGGGTLLVGQLVEALRYKSEGRRFDSQ
jgi:hypothetical protein